MPGSKNVTVLTMFLAVVSGFTACGGSSTSKTTPPPLAPTPTTSDGKADALIAQMTQAEKLQMVQGAAYFDSNGKFIVPRGAGGWTPGISRLGIPDLYFADGSAGASVANGPATALPSSLASAAGWDLNEAYKYGTVIGTELSDYGINVNLGGNVNMTARDPRDGRTFETKGEDQRELLGRLQRRLQVVRRERPHAALPFRIRPLLHQLLPHQFRGGQQSLFFLEAKFPGHFHPHQHRCCDRS